MERLRYASQSSATKATLFAPSRPHGPSEGGIQTPFHLFIVKPSLTLLCTLPKTPPYCPPPNNPALGIPYAISLNPGGTAHPCVRQARKYPSAASPVP